MRTRLMAGMRWMRRKKALKKQAGKTAADADAVICPRRTLNGLIRPSRSKSTVAGTTALPLT